MNSKLEMRFPTPAFIIQTYLFTFDKDYHYKNYAYPLMYLPTEILIIIANYLDAQDIGNFRLASSQLASAGTTRIPRYGLSLLNTSETFEELRRILRCAEIAVNTKKLVLYDGEWPQCSRAEWESHPLLFGGNSRIEALDEDNNKAFYEYSAFMRKEQNRRFYAHVDIFQVLSLLPNLESITIADMQNWVWHPARYLQYSRLQKRIWISPYLSHDVAPAVEGFLLAFSGNFVNIKWLSISGSLDPAELELNWSDLMFPSIERLCVDSFAVSFNEEHIQQFLQAFPNLIELSMSFEDWGHSTHNIIGPLSWARLEKLYLKEIWSSEGDIFKIFQRHQSSLDLFCINNSTLTQGSWQSLFTRIKGLYSSTKIDAQGTLYEGFDKRLPYMNEETKDTLRNFLKDLDAPWPF